VIDNNRFSFNGKEYEYEHKFISDSIIVLRINNDNYIVKVDNDTENNNWNLGTAFNIDINSDNYKIICKSELDLLSEKFSNNKAGGKFKNIISSPMPGAIVKMNVKPGQRIQKGDVLLVLEAMKMENEIKAAKDCVVKEVLVKEKTSVEKGQVLIKLDGESK
ncbi:MAG: acetyl-CoA carboxylase biotin carboxyl carrier protein subunit, partial [Bacteroidetes bacterium]|nr:acetyl-CoA carboxylase biotin carboxyl carrier protein subunit [Bacteroidota bacterium]